MIRIKKFVLLLIVSVMISLSSGCGLLKEMFKTELVSNEGEINLIINEDYQKYFPYEVPSFTLEFEGSLNTTKQTTTNSEVIFTHNDDFKLSEVIGKLLNKYQNLNSLYTHQFSIDKEPETYLISYKNNPDGEKEYVKVLDSKIYNEVSYISLENGLVLTLNYSRIVDWDNNVYYRWQNTEAIRMILHYPLMVTENENGETMFLIIPLPAGVVYNFDTTTKSLDTILTKDKFKTDSSYYTYDYVNDWNIDTVKEFYINRFNGQEIDNKFFVEYLGYKFEIVFNEKSFTFYYKK